MFKLQDFGIEDNVMDGGKDVFVAIIFSIIFVTFKQVALFIAASNSSSINNWIVPYDFLLFLSGARVTMVAVSSQRHKFIRYKLANSYRFRTMIYSIFILPFE